MITNRRNLLAMGASAAGLMVLGAGRAFAQGAGFSLPDAEWHKRLSPAAYAVLRQSGTEPPFTSPLLNEHRRGTFLCAGCAEPLFASDTKFDSGTGWPSFFRPLPGGIGTHGDHELIEERTEVHCSRCAGHLGHVFDDGPPPTGKRYCMNGVALSFRPAGAR